MTDLMGLGLSLTYTCATLYPAPFQFKMDAQNVLTWAFLAVTLLSSLIAFPVCNYLPGTRFGVYLILVYAAFLVAAVLLEVYY